MKLVVQKHCQKCGGGRELARLDGEPCAGPLDGVFAVGVIMAEGGYVRGQWVPAGDVVMMDPRSVIWSEAARMVYDPRKYVAQMPKDMRRWMSEHPDWPPAKP